MKLLIPCVKLKGWVKDIITIIHPFFKKKIYNYVVKKERGKRLRILFNYFLILNVIVACWCIVICC